jgi:hypothetical protein
MQQDQYLAVLAGRRIAPSCREFAEPPAFAAHHTEGAEGRISLKSGNLGLACAEK